MPDLIPDPTDGLPNFCGAEHLIAGVIVTVAVVAIIGNLANKAVKRVTDAHAQPEPHAQLPA